MEKVSSPPAPQRLELAGLERPDEDMVPVLRAKSGAERLRIAWDLYESALEMMAHHLAAEHPDWSEDRLHREVTRRLAHETG